ncbi:hypothetical protein M2390_000647 [Mycetocola sp. BIGb0189]|nr:hypothetical protein [Mycetocola sp. BIGb0189]
MTVGVFWNVNGSSYLQNCTARSINIKMKIHNYNSGLWFWDQCRTLAPGQRFGGMIVPPTLTYRGWAYC